MKKWLALLVALMMALAACGGDDASDDDGGTTGQTDAGFTDLGGRTVTVGVENAYIPFNYIPVETGEPEGWDYDYWEAVCELLNCVPDFIESGWPAVIDQVANGEIDTAADGISITDERREIVDYSDAYMIVIQRLVVQLDDDRYADADALIADPDAIVGTQVGTTNYELAAELIGEDRIEAFDQFALAIQALISGDVDAVIIDDAAGLGYIGENADQITTLPGDLQSDPLGFIFPQGSELVGPVNEAIAELAANGTFAEIGRKYFRSDFEYNYDNIQFPEE